MAFGFRQGLGYLCGVILGTNGVLLLIATGVTALVLAQPLLISAITIFAAVYILYLAWKIATAPVGAKEIAVQAAPSTVPGLVLALANPKAFAAIGAVYAGRRLIEESLLYDTLAKVVALTFVIVVVNTAWLLFGSVFSNLLNHPRLGRLANITFAIMLVASVGFALASS